MEFLRCGRSHFLPDDAPPADVPPGDSFCARHGAPRRCWMSYSDRQRHEPSSAERVSTHLAVERAIELSKGPRRHTWAELDSGELRRVEPAGRAEEVLER